MWAACSRLTAGGHAQNLVVLHRDGSGWTEITGAPPARGAFALGPNAIYTGAGYHIGQGASFFDGSSWSALTDVPGLDVHVFEGEGGPGRSGWLFGRETVGGKKPFAARLEASGGGSLQNGGRQSAKNPGKVDL